MEKKTTQEKEKYQPSYETTILTEVKCFKHMLYHLSILGNRFQSKYSLTEPLRFLWGLLCQDLTEPESLVKF